MRTLRIASKRALFALGLLVLCSAEVSSARLALAPGDPAPAMKGFKYDKDVHLVDFSAGSLTVVNFWASWCEPCKEEMPALQKLWEQHGEQGLQLVGIFVDSATNDAMRQYSERLGVTYPVIRPAKNIVQQWGGSAVLPLTFLVSSEGRILRRYVGATEEQVEGLVRDVENALQGKPLGLPVVPETPNVADKQSSRPAAVE